ncbi:conjugal transfer protein TraG N-terminal domain-containing protein, partial [Xenorhabdus koppenhoeferi]|uniref:conjugal transfer protein TraG N-terminal domain-containing protein n=1 Tax=Xenorhabdus koppenhoeferi TaxID=351659 RepID=UPI0038CD17DA
HQSLWLVWRLSLYALLVWGSRKIFQATQHKPAYQAPLILLLAAYEFKTVLTLTFVIFALNFLTFWWELARWLDSYLLDALYGSDTHSLFNLAGLQNTSDDLIMALVMGMLFIVLPMAWLHWPGPGYGWAMWVA